MNYKSFDFECQYISTLQFEHFLRKSRYPMLFGYRFFQTSVFFFQILHSPGIAGVHTTVFFSPADMSVQWFLVLLLASTIFLPWLQCSSPVIWRWSAQLYSSSLPSPSVPLLVIFSVSNIVGRQGFRGLVSVRQPSFVSPHSIWCCSFWCFARAKSSKRLAIACRCTWSATVWSVCLWTSVINSRKYGGFSSIL